MDPKNFLFWDAGAVWGERESDVICELPAAPTKKGSI